MIEKAARALSDLPCRCAGDAELDELRRREAVRAVLLSIREPSDDVTDAMIDMLTERGCNPLSGDAEAVWQTGIDTIINEGAAK